MNDPGFFSVALAQRACRRFANDPVPDADLATMLEAATHAPSAENTQPWIFVVVREDETRRALGELTGTLWREHGRAVAEAALEPRMFADADHFFGHDYGGAPALVVVAAEGTSRAQLGSSVYPAVQNLLLAAGALGYGSAMTTLATYVPDELALIVSLPTGCIPFAVVPIGRPARPLGPPRRRPVSAVAHAERYGTPFPA
jgi:nitroreductase